MITCYTFLLFFSCLRGCGGGARGTYSYMYICTNKTGKIQHQIQNITSTTHSSSRFIPAKHPGDTLFPLLVRLDTAVQDPCKQGSTSRQLTTP
ncbi:hypothetical protein J3E69DRAFT_320540 [Trichoderma sp. SZMC 28015]